VRRIDSRAIGAWTRGGRVAGRRFLVVLLAAWAGAVLPACGKSNPSAAQQRQAPAPIEVKLTPVVVRPAERFVEVTGTLYGEEEVTIAAEVPGRIVGVHADLGDVVPHGAVLAQIDPTDYALAVEEARAALLAALARLGLSEVPRDEVDLSTLPVVARAEAQAANAAARLDRARRLYDRTPPLISEQDFADIQTQSEVARAEVESERLNARSLLAETRVRQSALARAQQGLDDTRVVAPRERDLRYRVAAKQVSVGEVVSEGTPLFRLVASDRVEVRAQVPERLAGEAAIGANVLLFVDGIPEPFEAQLARVAPAVDVATRSFEIEIEANNPDGALKPGGFVRARLHTRTDPNAVFVPASAVAQFAGVSRVFSVREGKVAEHRVAVGAPRDGLVEVTGLPAGVEAVVAEPPRGIVAGAPAQAR